MKTKAVRLYGKMDLRLDEFDLPEIKDGDRMAIIGGCGPMGLAAIDYALSGEFRPRQLVVTDVDTPRLNQAQSLFAKKKRKPMASRCFSSTRRNWRTPGNL